MSDAPLKRHPDKLVCSGVAEEISHMRTSEELKAAGKAELSFNSKVLLLRENFLRGNSKAISHEIAMAPFINCTSHWSKDQDGLTTASSMPSTVPGT